MDIFFFMNNNLVFNLLSSLHDEHNLKMKRGFCVCQSFHITSAIFVTEISLHSTSL